MRCRMLVVLMLSAVAAQADELVLQAADRVFAAVHDKETATLEGLARQDHPDPWLVAEELCFRGVNDAAAAFAAATKQRRLAAYVASRKGKEPDTQVRRAFRAAHRLRMENAGDEAWAILSGIERPDDPVLRIRLNTLRAKTLRDLDDHPRSDKYFLHAGKLAHQLGWRRRATESLCHVAYRYCFGTAGGASRMWLVRRKLEPGEAAVVYGRPADDLLAAVVTAERTSYVPLGEVAAIEAARAEFTTPRVGGPVLVDELRARVVAPLGLGKEIRRVFVVPIQPLIDLPWVLLLGDREVVLGCDDENVSAFGDWGKPYGAWEEGPYGDGVLAIGRPRHKGSTAAELEARAVGDTVLVGHELTWKIDEAAAARPRWRALHLAGPREFAEQWSDKATDLLVLSVDHSFGLVHKPEFVRGPFLQAPRTIVSLWEVDPEATCVLMRRFYALWNGKVVSLPACTALKLAQDFVRTHAEWKHPYYWAGWQLWASQDPWFRRKGGN